MLFICHTFLFLKEFLLRYLQEDNSTRKFLDVPSGYPPQIPPEMTQEIPFKKFSIFRGCSGDYSWNSSEDFLSNSIRCLSSAFFMNCSVLLPGISLLILQRCLKWFIHEFLHFLRYFSRSFLRFLQENSIRDWLIRLRGLVWQIWFYF